ncbi:TetR/AcrR family transcriptional regulator [Rummeliibacillus sp. SL167]|uniref:TetR/AcrR family transcriptional regulator n=1 Tax=Rummeliibacillus sp. SL167 TaxID=2579792 RepID=UPI0011B6E151|nr:TetR/AcrR family transcriptional regulator [Rummeliibacillus sp. SL167]
MSKRDLIIEKSIEILFERSIASTSIQDITNACGISKGAFYLSFKSKEELLIAIFEYLIQDMILKYQELINLKTEPKEKLRQYFVLSFKLFEKNYPFISTHARELINIVDKEVIDNIQTQCKIADQITLLLLKDIYGSKIEESKYDLSICIHGMMKGYAEFIVLQKQSVDYYELSKFLVNRIDVLVHADLTPLITKEMYEQDPKNHVLIKKEDILDEITKCKEQYIDDSFMTDTFELIMEELQKEHPRKAILLGMSSNLVTNNLNWLAILLKQYINNM